MVENNPEGGDGSESALPTIYVCEYCKEKYEREDEACACECYHREERDAYYYGMITKDYYSTVTRMMFEMSMKVTEPGAFVKVSDK